MPALSANGVSLHYEEQGSGPEAIVFAHGVLWSGAMFSEQVNHFKNRFRCITFDFRGHGQSETTKAGYDMDTLCEDTAAVITSLGCIPCHFVGLSLGGIIGLRLCLRSPELFKSLSLLATSADAETAEKKRRYRALSFVARWFGTRIVANRVMPIMFGRTFMTDASRSSLREEWRQRFISNNRRGATRGVMGVSTRNGVFEQIHKIATPTLILAGAEDVATPPERLERIHTKIVGSKFVVIPRAGHTASVEEPARVNAELDLFIGGLA